MSNKRKRSTYEEASYFTIFSCDPESTDHYFGFVSQIVHTIKKYPNGYDFTVPMVLDIDKLLMYLKALEIPTEYVCDRCISVAATTASLKEREARR